MEEENTTEGCPICLCDYTTLGDHRVVSLKCGHLFGQQCIYSWFNRKKSALCPKCCLKSKESDIRPIFANKIVAIDSVREEESIRELNIERKLRSELQLEITKLKTTINYLNSELIKKQESIVKEKSNFLHKRFFKKFNTKINKNSLMVYEKMNDFLLISYFENKLGIKKINTFGLKSVEFFSVADFFIDNSLKEIKINPFNDGTFGIIYDNSFKLFTSYNNKEIFHFCHDTKLTSFSFDQQFRNIIFLGTEDGKVLVYDLDKKRIKKEYSVTDCPIHSIYKMEEEIYCAGFKGVFLIKDNEISRVEKRGYPVCTNLFSDENNILGIFRDGNMAVMHYLINTDVCINLNRIHFRRNRDKIYDNFLFTIDDTNRDIIVFDFVKWKIIYKYEVNDPIIDFVSTNEKFFLLTEGGIHIFID